MNFRGQAWFFQTVEQILIDDPTLDLNARDSQGMTALHYAVQRGSAEIENTAGTSRYQGQPPQRAQTHPRTTGPRAKTNTDCQND